MNKIYTLLVFALFLCVSTADAQIASLKSYQKAAKKAMENKNYFGAMQYYRIALKIDDSRIYNYYNLGEAARNFKSFNIAKDAYNKVLDSQSDDFPLTNLWMGDVYHSQGKYDTAMVYYDKFLNPPLTTKGPNDAGEIDMEFYKALATKAKNYCSWAIERNEYRDEGYNIIPFSDINTDATEFAPLEHQQKIFYSGLEYDTENYCLAPSNEVTRMYTTTDVTGGIPSATNWAKEEEGKYTIHTAFNKEDDIMFFTECTRINASEFDCQIYQRKRDENTGLWGDAYLLPNYVNQAGTNNTQPNIGYDENTDKDLLFFSSNRPDSVGGANGDYNIYCSFIEANGQVGTPVKLEINTEEDDITPFYNKANKTLYFSSKGYEGYGGFDVFKSVKDGSNWSTPESMGQPLNSSYDDIYFSTDENFDNGYIATNRLGVVYKEEGLETCCHDIFKVENIKVDLNVLTFCESLYD